MSAAVATLMDTPPEEGFDRITRLVTTLLETPVALVSLVDEKRQFFKSQCGLSGWAREARGTPISHSFCRHVVERDTALVVADAREHPLLRESPAIRDLGVVAYLGEPVRSAEGRPLGALCAIGPSPRRWSARDREIIKGLAAAVTAEIGFRETLAERDQALSALQAANARLTEARRVAEEALVERTRFFASLGHELRTPLNGLLGGLSLLEIARDETEATAYRRMVRNSADALMEFVDDVVDYASSQSEGAKPARLDHFEPLRPMEVASEAVAGAARAKGLSLRVEHADTAPREWVGDSDRIGRILINLAGNAIKYTEMGEIVLRATMEGGRLVYRVSDTGVGVPDSHRDAIFRAFERGDPEVSQRTRGTGLGLAIARRSAEALGGRLSLEASAPRRGSVFRLELPRLTPVELEATAA